MRTAMSQSGVSGVRTATLLAALVGYAGGQVQPVKTQVPALIVASSRWMSPWWCCT